MTSSPKHERATLRLIAVFEAMKGLVVVAAGFGLLTLLHRNVAAVAEEIVKSLHLNPSHEITRIFLHLADQMDDGRIWMLAAGAAAYAAIRLAEGYGLWRERVWAEWLGIVSGGIYIPVELYELARKVTAVRGAVFVCNVAIVGWLAWDRWCHHRRAGA